MNPLEKNFFSEQHFNPINRDLVVVLMISLLAAVAFVTMGVMVFSQL
jgi:hypothetical protein